MIDLLAWILEINDKGKIRKELERVRRQKAQQQFSLERRVTLLEAENEELKIRLGVVIRMLARNGTLDARELVAEFNEFKDPGNQSGTGRSPE